MRGSTFMDSETQYLMIRASQGDVAAAITLVGDLPLNLANAPRMGWGEQVGNAKWRAEIPYKPTSFIGYDDEPGIAIYKAFVAYTTLAHTTDYERA